MSSGNKVINALFLKLILTVHIIPYLKYINCRFEKILHLQLRTFNIYPGIERNFIYYCAW